MDMKACGWCKRKRPGLLGSRGRPACAECRRKHQDQDARERRTG